MAICIADRGKSRCCAGRDMLPAVCRAGEVEASLTARVAREQHKEMEAKDIYAATDKNRRRDGEGTHPNCLMREETPDGRSS